VRSEACQLIQVPSVIETRAQQNTLTYDLVGVVDRAVAGVDGGQHDTSDGISEFGNKTVKGLNICCVPFDSTHCQSSRHRYWLVDVVGGEASGDEECEGFDECRFRYYTTTTTSTLDTTQALKSEGTFSSAHRPISKPGETYTASSDL